MAHKPTVSMDGIVEIIASDPSIMSDLEGLLSGDVTWSEIDDVPGIDVETGSPIPDGRTEA